MNDKQHRFDGPNVQRDRQDRASKGPKPTFYCTVCGKLASLLGRRKLRTEGKRTIFQCALCVAQAGSISTTVSEKATA
jgi:hypothetical protein